jgi:hypothetical protein
MGGLREKMKQDLDFAGFADNTKWVYLSAAARRAKFHNLSPAEMTLGLGLSAGRRAAAFLGHQVSVYQNARTARARLVPVLAS